MMHDMNLEKYRSKIQTAYLQQNGVENRDAALAEFRTLRDFYNKCQDFHGDDDYILVVGIYRD